MMMWINAERDLRRKISFDFGMLILLNIDPVISFRAEEPPKISRNF